MYDVDDNTSRTTKMPDVLHAGTIGARMQRSKGSS